MLALAAAARKACQPFAEKPLEVLKQNAVDQPSLFGAIYFALANPDDAAYRAKLKPYLVKPSGDDTAADLRTLGRLLLETPTEADRAELVRMLGEGVWGEDRVALAAFASRKLGGTAWETLRASSRDVLGSQPLAGDVVVLVNRLPQMRGQ